MLSLLLIGFLIGMRHVLEADHVTAVASLVSCPGNRNSALKQGAIWGLDHTRSSWLAAKEHVTSQDQHSHGFPKRALLVGLMHGMAGQPH